MSHIILDNIRFDDEYLAGQLVVLTSGSYDTYGVQDVVRVTKDFSLKGILAKLIEEQGIPEDYHYYWIDTDWLVREGYVEKLDFEYLHTD